MQHSEEATAAATAPKICKRNSVTISSFRINQFDARLNLVATTGSSAMRIGQLAARTGCDPETIRYYERAGILPQPQRAPNNYRDYGSGHLQRLRFVRRCRFLGFSLDEVRRLLELIDGADYSCAEIEAIGRRHLEDVRGRIADLRMMESSLAELVSGCSGGNSPDCSMLERLFS